MENEEDFIIPKIEEEEEEEEIEIENTLTEKQVLKKVTLPVMSIYEKTIFLTTRVKQLDDNYKTMLSEEVIRQKNLTQSIDIAIEEFDTRNFPPISIKRPFPNGNYEIWKFEEFELYPE